MRVLVALLLLTPLLAGCTDEPDPLPEPDPAYGVVTDPKDYSYVQTDGGGWHVHDYWGGKDRLELLDAERPTCQCTVSYGADHGATIATFQPGPDHVVPQGTAWLHATATWDIENGDYEGVGLWVQTANQTEPVFVGELEPGVPLNFSSSHDDNDPPHQTLSLWVFEVRAMSPDGQGATASGFSATLQVDVQRGLEILPWPPHPDFWNGATELVLEQATRTVSYDIQASLAYACTGCVGGPRLDDGIVVPFDADRVLVDVTSADTELPVLFGLMAHGADRREFTELQPITDEPHHRTWSMDTEGFYADSPYSKQSLWEFDLYKDEVRPNAENNTGFWQGTYTVTVTAVKDS